MMLTDKSRLEKSRTTVKSRYQSPAVAVTEPPPTLSLLPSLNQLQKQQKTSLKNNNSGLFHGVWPSSTQSSKSDNDNQPTLADYLGSGKKRDTFGSSFLSKQRSCSEFNRFENNPKKINNLKENHKPIIGGGSMRYTGKFRFPGRSSTSSSSSSSDGAREELSVIMSGRLSVDENELRQRSYSRMRSDSFSDDSEGSDIIGSSFVTQRNSPASYMAPTISSRKSVSDSPTKFTIKKAMKKANSLSLTSKWGLSGRSESPPVIANSSFSSSKPPTSPSRTAKRNFLHMGLDLIKSKKNGSGCLSPLGAGIGMVENVHQLRMMNGSLMQWRYANARANVVNESLNNKAKSVSLQAWESLVKLQESVLQKRLQLEKEKMGIKLGLILHSQIKSLEAWKDMETRHRSNVSMTKDSLEAVVCRITLIEGAKMNTQATMIALGHATDLVDSVMSTTLSLMPTKCETVSIFTELAKVAIEEKMLLEECFEHFRVISTLETKERSLRCSIIEMNSCLHAD
ncbi:QWRF motif-containing protein 3-like [Rutidosis leptorrhynchoides]|uniref:QWRF motif-containing protein 3-like n=1 Tax=Rutidosis leptorrhynchoides TaxID=125765 RepID=UPI003A99A972